MAKPPAPKSLAPAPLAGAPRKNASVVAQGGVLVVLTLLAAGMGVFAGGQLAPAAQGETKAAPAPAAHKAAAASGHGAGSEGEGEGAPGNPLVVPLAPINTTLAAPENTWIRMEVAVAFAQPPEPGLADSIHQDLLAFVRTVKLHQIEGPSGFLHLRADLDERAKLRSGGKAERVLIHTLLFE